ncbi:hypothetical protein [Janibacter hoylei]|uniref:DedA family protein n=1 Tax=Janibacter hoylei PVAS-1 TaxID=1210046 RepID=K1E5X9_9MICO|nr:hypothetical protein [Janibacter hoylei]EKA60762.1 hypothetical protein B277_11305 [Janibacter hoylei PVAS-1]MCT1619770.1 hypothetical protein [Janibacter hoylei]MCT2293566.1 hypothetical protein [Janibacter hoylei]MCW4600692.1 hypothetical protein [Janibacter hoylei]RWU85473.1 hypothetical protein CWN80_00300 [Janibacter hoylei PVAS-1]
MTNVPDWLIATGLVGAVLFGLLSAFFPPLNAEIYALAAPVIFPDAWVVHVCAMTGGLVVGKMSHFFVAEKGAEAYTRRREAKEAREAAEDRRPTGPVRARFARWSKAMIDVLDRPRLGPLVMLASSGIGFPPLAVVTVAAGIKRVNMVLFFAVTTIGCLARFLVTAWLVSRGISLGH